MFVGAADRALNARGALERLLPLVLQEREAKRQERAEARRAAAGSSLRCNAATHSEVAGDDKDVKPTNRRGLLGAGAAAALGVAGVAAAPAAAHEVDPELPVHSMQLMRLLEDYDCAFGPRTVIDVVHHQQRQVALHRKVAHGELRTMLLRVEARWSNFASWL